MTKDVVRDMNLFMDVRDCWGMDIGELKSKSRNIYLGVSINNKKFNLWSLGNYIDWGVKYTNQKFAVVLVDTPQAYNNMVFGRLPYNKALTKAREKSAEIEEICMQLRKGLANYERKKFAILKWSDITKNEDYLHNLDVICDEYKNNEEFADFINSTIKKSLGPIIDRVHTSDEMNLLSKYLLEEIPVVLNGFSHYDKKENRTLKFNVNIYPGDMKSVARVREKEFFKPALKKMRLNSTINAVLDLNVTD